MICLKAHIYYVKNILILIHLIIKFSHKNMDLSSLPQKIIELIKEGRHQFISRNPLAAIDRKLRVILVIIALFISQTL